LEGRWAEKGSTYVAQAGLELVILPAQSPECWNYKHVLLCLAFIGVSSKIQQEKAIQVWYFLTPTWVENSQSRYSRKSYENTRRACWGGRDGGDGARVLLVADSQGRTSISAGAKDALLLWRHLSWCLATPATLPRKSSSH
jgi:hypothetical protein